MATFIAPDLSVNGSLTAQNTVPAGIAPAGSAVEIEAQGRDTLSIQVTGTYTGAISVQGTIDGTTWVTLAGGAQLVRLSNGAASGSIASATQDIYQCGIGAFTKIRVTGLAAWTGTAVITLRATDGNSYVGLDAPIPAGTASIGFVGITPGTGTSYTLVTAASTNAASIKSTAGALTEITISNVTATPIFVKLYNKASAPTVGTDVPVWTIPVAANSSYATELGLMGKRFATGIAIAATAAAPATDVAVAVAGVQINATYQ
jgi:hypothetical protein